MEAVQEVGYIYGLYSSENPELIRYIGYTYNPDKRMKEHIKESKYMLYRKHNWIQGVLKDGFTIGMNILRCVPYNSIGVFETEVILLYKSFGADLVNGNNGGIGGGKSPSKETRRKISESKKGNTWNKGRKPYKNQFDEIKIS